MGLIILPTGCVTGGRGFKSPIENFDKVDDKVLRGAQPNAIGLAELVSVGVTDVIDLREDSWLEEKPYCKNLGMKYHSIPFDPFLAPTKESLAQVMRVIKSAKGRVFIHCQYGADRTGTVVAIYRILKGETNQAAFDDAVKHGLSAWEVGMRELIKHFKPESLPL